MRFLDWLKKLLKAPAGRPEAPATTAPPRRQADADRTLLQFPRGKRTIVTDIVVGLDFGTSCTRIAMQSPYKPDRRVTAVDFGRLAHPSSRFLLPTTVYSDPQDRLSLAPAKETTRVVRHLKVALLSTQTVPEESAWMAWASAYLGMALRESRAFFLRTQSDIYGSDELRWSLNLGIPSAGYDDEVVRARFHRLARAAWLLSMRDEPPTHAAALEALSQVSLATREEVDIDVIPEVAAQVVGYAKSRHRREGLHLLLDMGASTLDLCAFCLHERAGDDNYELLTADVQPLGLLELHRRRVTTSGGHSPFEGIPDDLVRPLPDWHGSAVSGEPADRLRAADAGFIDECRRVLVRTLLDLRKKRDPKSPRWQGGLPLFVCGGGAKSRVVAAAVQNADAIGRKSWAPYGGLRPWPLPVPPSISWPKTASEDFGRFSVAFGLSHPRINVGHIEPPSSIEDITNDVVASDWQSRFVGKDQV